MSQPPTGTETIIGADQLENRPDDYHQAVPHKLTGEQIRALSRLNPAMSWFAIGREWALIAGAIALCLNFWHPALYVLAVMWIGARQHGLLVIMHEGSHFRMFKNRALNDWVSEVLCAWPHFLTMHGYRREHIVHHHVPNTAEDPDWVRKLKSQDWHFPKTRAQVLRILAMDLAGLNIAQQIARYGKMIFNPAGKTKMKLHPLQRVAHAGFYLALVGVVTAFGWWPEFLMYWVVPFVTWAKMTMRLRGIGDHFGLDHAHAYDMARTVKNSWFDSLFVAPNHINYHLEHHLYPSVPFYRLPELHRTLMANPEYAAKAHLTHSYWGVIREVVAFRPKAPAEQPAA